MDKQIIDILERDCSWFKKLLMFRDHRFLEEKLSIIDREILENIYFKLQLCVILEDKLDVLEYSKYPAKVVENLDDLFPPKELKNKINKLNKNNNGKKKTKLQRCYSCSEMV